MGKSNGQRHHFLYKSTNLINNKFYVGVHSTYNLKDGYLGSGKRLKKSIEKYGKENFKIEILEFFESREELLKKESEVVNEILLADEKCMNLKCGGIGQIKFLTPTEENQFKWSSAGGKAYGKKLKTDASFKEKISEKRSASMIKRHKKGSYIPDWTGKKHKEETKKKIGDKISTLQKGKNNSQYGTLWINKGKENKKIKEENLQSFLKKGWIKGRKLK